ncbi:hypothetical protein [Moheibacter stercoris]|uniref:mRNA-degrading endonuclease RelE of RelBE toxin-antitoxin system n=1 Tax=Moheibacter stercoris TaxID=1628251 RepID=A0ABV2LVN6_9FLAO
MEVTIKDIEKNLEKLPKEYLTQVNDFINYLKEQKSLDEEIPQWHIYEVQKRRKELLDHPENIVSEEDMDYFLKNFDQ